MPPPQQPRPVSSKPITGTDWLEVTNDNGTKFWHNTATNQGVWTKPAEVIKAARAPPPLDAAKLKMLERARASGAVIAPEYKAAGKGDKDLLLLEGGSSGGGGSSKTKKASALSHTVATQEEEEEDEEYDVTFTEEDIDVGDGEEEREDEKKKEVVDKGAKTKNERSTAPLPPPSGPPPPSAAKEAAIEAAFRDLLKENSIHGFSRYEKELPKLQKDPRFGALLPPERRRAVFEDYCSKVGIVSKSKEPSAKDKKQGSKQTATATGSFLGHPTAASIKAAEDAYKALLQERVVHPDVRWYRVKEDLKKDSRFDSSTILAEERKEELFREHIDSLYRAEEARERAEKRAEHAKRAGEERQRYAQAAAAEQNFKVLLGEAVRDAGAEWESTWQRLQRDPQGRATDPMLDVHVAERMFGDHVAQLKAVLAAEDEGDGGREPSEAGEAKKGMDPAYARAYLEGRDAKRAKRDT
jgi:transcription elongation regulator 1